MNINGCIECAKIKYYALVIDNAVPVRNAYIGKSVSLRNVYNKSRREIHMNINVLDIRRTSFKRHRIEQCRCEDVVADMNSKLVHDSLIRELVVSVDLDVIDSHRGVECHEPYQHKNTYYEQYREHRLKVIRKIRQILLLVLLINLNLRLEGSCLRILLYLLRLFVLFLVFFGILEVLGRDNNNIVLFFRGRLFLLLRLHLGL